MRQRKVITDNFRWEMTHSEKKISMLIYGRLVQYKYHLPFTVTNEHYNAFKSSPNQLFVKTNTSKYRLTRKFSPKWSWWTFKMITRAGPCRGQDMWYLCYITKTSKCARRRLKSPVSRLFAQSFVQAQIKEHIKDPHRWPLWGAPPVR